MYFNALPSDHRGLFIIIIIVYSWLRYVIFLYRKLIFVIKYGVFMKFILVGAVSIFAFSVSAAKFPDVRQATIELIGIDGEKVQEVVQFENVDGVAMFEGDIILGKTEDIVYGGHSHKLSGRDIKANGLYNSNIGAKWPNGRVPYVIAASFTTSERDAIITYMREIEAVANVQFVPRTNESAYINMVSTSDVNICGSSAVGRQGGPQDLKLRCFGRRTITHELMHALGFWHEQSRPDRDNYIAIHWSNVEPTWAYNLEARTSQVATHGGYDYSSIMHYHSYAFAKDPSKPTMSVLPTTSFPTPVLGGDVMTDGDKAALAHVYGGPLVQPYVTYGYVEIMKCTNQTFHGILEWDAVESDLNYELETAADGMSWTQIYSGPNNFTPIGGASRQTKYYRVRAIKNGAPGSWYKFPFVPSCGRVIQ